MRPPTLAAATATLTMWSCLSACTGDDPEPTRSSAVATPDCRGVSRPDAHPRANGGRHCDAPRGPGTVEVAVRSLDLDDNGTTMTLRVDFTPHLAEPDTDAMTLSAINGYFFIHPELLDREHLKRYSVIVGEDGLQDWLTNKDATTANDETLSSWFVYAAPEDDVDAFTLTMDGWGLEIPDVEVSS